MQRFRLAASRPGAIPGRAPAAAGLLVLALSAVLSGNARAQMFGPDYTACGKRPNTMETVDCVGSRLRYWDGRLNAAYAALGRRVEPQQQGPLRDAERLWIQFRDANCAFYGSQSGTIARIQGAECLRAMTEARATELEDAAKP